MKKRTIGVFLMLCMVLIILPTASAAAGTYDLENGDIAISVDANGQTVTQNGSTVSDAAPVITGGDGMQTITVVTEKTASANFTIQNIKACQIDVDAATATITVAGENTITNDADTGIHISDGDLTISGAAGSKLTVTTTDRNSAAIGSGYYEEELDPSEDMCGFVTITGSVAVEATSAREGAAIGSGYFGKMAGYITICDYANVTATSSNYGAAIGSGAYGIVSGEIGICDHAKVTATGSNNGAAIGSGYLGSMSGLITICDDAEVSATGQRRSAAIGSGSNRGVYGYITICDNANVTAEGGRESAAIGSGCNGDMCGYIAIADKATVTTTRGRSSADIGSGLNGDALIYISISDTATITSTDGTPKIGPGSNGKYLYNVIFNKNAADATGYMKDLMFEHENRDSLATVAQPLTANSFKRPGYTFAGWSTSSHGEVKYKDQEVVSGLIGEKLPVVLYAQWKEHTDHVDEKTPKHYCDVCGLRLTKCVDVDPQDHICDICTKTLTCTDDDKDHYCDYCGEELTQHDYDEYGICSICGASQYNTTVFFDAGGGIVSPKAMATNANGKLSSLPTPTRRGYNFLGWFLQDGTQIDTDMVFETNTTVYAHWQVKSSALLPTWQEWEMIDKIVAANKKKDEAVETEPEVTEPVETEPVETEPVEEVEPTVEPWNNPFSDVAETDAFYEAVKFAYENGYMNGMSENTFAPNEGLTRAMLMTVLYRATGSPVVGDANPFTDVAEDAWYYNAVVWAKSIGLVTGITETEFAPENLLTREQLVTIFYRYANFLGYDVSEGEDTNILSYEDFADIAEYAIPAMQWACGAGLIENIDGNILPKDNATRALVAMVLFGFYA